MFVSLLSVAVQLKLTVELVSMTPCIGELRFIDGATVSTRKVTLVEFMLPDVSFAHRIIVDCWLFNAVNDVFSVRVVFTLLYSYHVVFKCVSELV